MLSKVCAWITVITFTKIYWILPMHSNVTIKNVSWPHFSWPALYMSGMLLLIWQYSERSQLSNWWSLICTRVYSVLVRLWSVRSSGWSVQTGTNKLFHTHAHYSVTANSYIEFVLLSKCGSVWADGQLLIDIWIICVFILYLTSVLLYIIPKATICCIKWWIYLTVW